MLDWRSDPYPIINREQNQAHQKQSPLSYSALKLFIFVQWSFYCLKTVMFLNSKYRRREPFPKCGCEIQRNLVQSTVGQKTIQEQRQCGSDSSLRHLHVKVNGDYSRGPAQFNPFVTCMMGKKQRNKKKEKEENNAKEKK